MTIALRAIDHLTGGKFGEHDVPCPECGPLKRSARNQRKPVLRVWQIEEGFASFHCARCGIGGYTSDRSKSTPPDPVKLALARAKAAERDRALKGEQLSKARWLWSLHKPPIGSVVEVYLRSARGYDGPLPETLGFLPARGDHPPAMIAAFGFAHETEPGVIAIADAAVTGVHLTRLATDGSGKAVFEDPDEPTKIMLGHSAGSPIVLAPLNDLLGLAVVEGIEDGLSAYQISGVGVWVAGAASRMPALADAIPLNTDWLTVLADDDADGRRHAQELVKRARARGIAAEWILSSAMLGARAS
jgi:hypothetical protein